MATISWQELIVLMCFGEPDTYSGVVHVREVEPDVRESSHRVFRRGRLLRRERPDGRPFAILGVDTNWMWMRGAELPTAFPRSTSSWGFSDHGVVDRPALDRWEGDDFTRPAGPITATTFLGRAAWEVELAPPPHKPHPLTLVADAETGIVLQQRNDGFGSVEEWTEIAFGADLPDALFTWDGEALSPSDHSADHDRDMAERENWMFDQGLTKLSLRVRVRPHLHEYDEATGAFTASIETLRPGSLMRRPKSGEPWDTGTHYEFDVRWSDEHFDWYLGTVDHLSAPQVADLRAQLTKSASTPDR